MAKRASEGYDSLTEQFHKETGIWPPGRDRAAALGPEDICDVRFRAFETWKKLRDERAEEKQWHNMIAVLCSDGGHYLAEHGVEKTKEHIIDRFHNMVAEIEQLRMGSNTATANCLQLNDENDWLLKVIAEAFTVCVDTEEINPSNYDHDLVCQLNNGMVEVYGILSQVAEATSGRLLGNQTPSGLQAENLGLTFDNARLQGAVAQLQSDAVGMTASVRAERARRKDAERTCEQYRIRLEEVQATSRRLQAIVEKLRDTINSGQHANYKELLADLTTQIVEAAEAAKGEQ